MIATANYSAWLDACKQACILVKPRRQRCVVKLHTDYTLTTSDFKLSLPFCFDSKRQKKKENVVGRIRTCAGKAHMISSHAR